LTDIAFAPKGDKLYGVSFTTLVGIDALTGATTSIGDIGYDGVNALAFSNTGVLYAATLYGDFLRLNTTTGQGTWIGSYGSGMSSTGDMVFLSNDTLYAVARLSGERLFGEDFRQNWCCNFGWQNWIL